jgi:uncharacterized protein YbaP (TraB family)
MKNNLFRFLLFTAFVVSSLTAATAQQVKPKTSEKTAETSALLYRITGKDLKKPSYLFGTIHIICQPDMLPMDKLNGYLDQTDRLVLEIDMDDAGEMQTMQKALLIPGGKTLQNISSLNRRLKLTSCLKARSARQSNRSRACDR